MQKIRRQPPPDGTEKVVLSYTKSDNTAGMKTVPVSYFASSGIDTSYMSDYIKYVNVFNNLADFTGSEKLFNAYLSNLSINERVSASITDVFFFKNSYFSADSYLGVSTAFFNRMYWAAKSGKYIDMSNTLIYFKDYDDYINNKYEIDNTYIAVIYYTYGLYPERYNASVIPVSAYAYAQLAIGRLSDVYGNREQSPIKLYNTGYFINVQISGDSYGSRILFSLFTTKPGTAYKLIDYRCSSQFSVWGK